MVEFSKYLALEKRLSEATVSAYRYVVRAFLAYLDRKGLEVGTAKPKDIADYLAVQSGRGLKAVSVFGMGMAIRSFCRFLISKGYAQSDPSENIELPKFHSRLPDPLTEEEVAKLLSFPAVRYVQIRDRAILELLYCGLRVSEALSLEKDRIHFEERYVRIRAAVHLLRAGVDINTIRAWLGHVFLDTTNIYAEIDLEMKAKALARCEVGTKVVPQWRTDKGLMGFLNAL